MNEPDLTSKLPQPTVGDWNHASVKAGLSLIPIVGGAAAELFALVIAPPLAKRRDKWLQSVEERLKKLESKVAGFKVEALANDEIFVTTMLRATQEALRTHQEEKLEALRNVVINTALHNTVDETKQQFFLSMVSELDGLDLLVLGVLSDVIKARGKHLEKGKDGRDVGPPTLHQVIFYSCPNGVDSSVLEAVLTRLDARHLIQLQAKGGRENVGRIDVMDLRGLITPFGREFVAFIAASN